MPTNLPPAPLRHSMSWRSRMGGGDRMIRTPTAPDEHLGTFDHSQTHAPRRSRTYNLVIVAPLQTALPRSTARDPEAAPRPVSPKRTQNRDTEQHPNSTREAA